MEFVRDEKKNEIIKQRSGGNKIGFEDVEYAIRNGNVIQHTINDNPLYGHQEMFVVMINNYPYKVPCIREDNKIRFITAYPSRKFKS